MQAPQLRQAHAFTWVVNVDTQIWHAEVTRTCLGGEYACANFFASRSALNLKDTVFLPDFSDLSGRAIVATQSFVLAL
eukprot:scaffold70256_cov66-Attheya_sp.AAC.2